MGAFLRFYFDVFILILIVHWLAHLSVFVLLGEKFIGALGVLNMLVDFDTNDFDPVYCSTIEYPKFWKCV